MDRTIDSLLAPLAVPPARTRQFSASLVVHALVLAVVALIPIAHPQSVSLRSSSNYVVMPLLSQYQPPRHIPAAPRAKLPPVPRLAPAETMARIELPRRPRSLEREIEAPKIAPAKFVPAIAPPAVVQPKLVREVKTGVLGEGSAVRPTVKAPANKVQTGGFGDENGINGEGHPNARLVATRLGSPDLPLGGGYGNGSAGARGARGTVASAGFGSGTASSVAGGTARQVQAGGFGDGAAAASGPARRLQPGAGELKPVEILSKPRPMYTAEARQLKIEGEVLLDVTFGADGTLRVQRVDRGLGHGLDEAAIRAAQQIRFRPARRDGQPLDTVAVLHIVFELAN